jgi:hypothetical protein
MVSFPASDDHQQLRGDWLDEEDWRALGGKARWSCAFRCHQWRGENWLTFVSEGSRVVRPECPGLARPAYLGVDERVVTEARSLAGISPL